MRIIHQLCLCLLGLFCFAMASAQSSANYNFTTSVSASLAADKYGNALGFAAAPDLISANNSTTNSTLQPIGFDFILMGKRYTHFIAGNDGEIALGLGNSPAGMLSAVGSNALSRVVSYSPTSFNDAPVLAAFWDDLRTSRTGATVRSVVTGKTPYRCLTVQWNATINTSSLTTTDPADGVFQLRLYESTGEIEYVYGKMTIGSGSSTVTASIGMATGPTDNSFIALKDLSSFGITRLVSEEFATRSLVNSATPGVISALHSTTDGVRRRFAFAPTPLNGNFSTAEVSRVYATSMQLNWTETSTNKLGYLLYRSDVDSNNYQLIGTLPPSTTSYAATNLATNTRYYWKLVPFTEGYKNTKVLTDSTRCTMTGSYTVGANGNFQTLKAANDSMILWGMVGNTTWQLLPNYSFANETLPVTLHGTTPCQNNTWSLIIEPANGASFQYANTSANPVFLLDSVNKITIDGRAGGTGVTAFVLEGNGELIKLKNSWNNSLQYLDFRSNTATTTASPLTIEGTDGGGSHDNSIANCSFHDRGNSLGLPWQLLSAKTAGSIANNNNQITNSDFYNFSRYAIDVDGRGWTIANNNFYATQPINSTTDSSGFIIVRSTDNTSTYQITNNHFGGTAAGSNGTALTWNSGAVFTGIYSAAKADIRNNDFRKLHIRCVTNQSYPYPTIDLVRVGLPGGNGFNTINFNVQQNSFGAMNTGDSLTFTSASPASLTVSIINNTQTGGNATITGNSLVHLHSFGNATAPINFHTIQTTGGLATITNNTIGTDVHQFRIEHKAVGTFAGIYTYGNAVISNNLLTNILSRKQITGIFTQSNFQSITGNTISHLKITEGIETYDWYSVCGIATFSGAQTISGNRILHMEDSSAAQTTVAPVSVFVNGSQNTINRNLIDGLSQHPQAAQKLMTAFKMYDNNSTITNNMVRLGVDSAGNTVTGGFLCYSNDYTSTNTVRHNTFYITGNNLPSETTNSSYSIFWLGPTSFANNIIVNNRTYTGTGSGRSFMYLISTEQQTWNLFDYNVYYRSSGNGNFTTSGDYTQWQAGGQSGRDPHSVVRWPNFVAAEGPTRSLDLHVSGVTAVESRGGSFYTVTEDFDGETRSSLTPVDIGADAGNFVPVDLDPPTFNITPLPDATDTSSRSITIQIADALSGLNATGNTRPTIWYRKNYPTTTPWQFAYGDLVSGTVNSGNWRFLINHQLLNVSPYGADSVQYYFVAQDTTTIPALNIVISPSAGALHTSVTQQVSPPLQPYRYRINVGRYLLPSVVDVGDNQRYTSLTRDGGVFEGLAKDSVQGDVTIRVVSHLTENGKWGVDSSFSKRGYQLKIVPALDSMFIITSNGDISTEMIRFANTANITIDGSYNGSGRWLRFINQNSVAANAKSTFYLTKGADNFKLLNCEVQGNAPGYQLQAVLYMNDGEYKNTFLQNNIFSSSAGSSFKAGAGVSTYWNAKMTSLTAVQNQFVNLENTGVSIGGTSSNLRIDSNHFYWNDPLPQLGNAYWAITISGSQAVHEVTGNFIGGSQLYCGGNYWINNGPFNEFVGIKIGSSSNMPSMVANNTVRNIKTTNTAASFFSAINTFGGPFLVDGNIIGDSTNLQSLVLANTGPVLIASGDKNNTVSNNLISGIVSTNDSWNTTLQAIRQTGDSNYVVRNNVIRNITMASSATGSTAGTLTGIAMGVNTANSRVEKNEIFNLCCTSAASVQITGIQSYSAYNGGGVIAANRIYNNTLPNSVNGVISGIMLYQNGAYRVENNQISLSNAGYSNPVTIYGILDNKSYNTNNNSSIAYNSIVIGGNQAANSSSSSFGYYNSGIGITNRFKNNLVFNNRSGGTGQHGGIAVKRTNPAVQWSSSSSDFNLFVLNDTAHAHLWGTTTMLSMKEWKNATSGDANSYVAFTQAVPATNLFVDVNKGNLNINNDNSSCWYLNGKGLPLADIADDYLAQGVRSTLAANGPTDIGSNEFNTTTTPPVLEIYGRHVPGGSDTLSMNGRLLAVIDWGETGSLPTLGNARFYSGTWPNDPTNNGSINNVHSFSSYLTIPATGGSDYRYNLQLFYDSSMIGRVQASQNAIVNKRQEAVPGSWTEIHPTVVDTSKKKLTAFNMTSFSEFTVTDSLASFVSGAPLADLTVGAASIGNSNIATGNPFTVSFSISNIGNGDAYANKVQFYLSGDNVLTPGANGDTLLGEYNIALPLAGNGLTGPFTKTLNTPCSIAADNYFVFVAADGRNEIAETNENNNTTSMPVNLTIGQTVPVPSLTSTNGGIVCDGASITLTASTTGCTSCLYTWNTGATGPSLSVNTAGTYTVSVSNVCGLTKAIQTVTAGVAPAVTIGSNMSSVCLGNEIALTASGAANYTWVGVGVKGSGSSVTATPTAPGTTTYSVTGANNGCSKSKSLQIIVNAVPPAPVITQSGNVLNSSAASGNQWYLNNVLINGATNASYTPQTSGVYTVTTTGNGCISTASAAFSYVTTGIDSPQLNAAFSTMPNPVHTNLFLKYKGAIASFDLQVFDITGRQVKPTTSFASTYMLNMEALPNGIYTIKIMNRRTHEAIKRIIVKQ